MNDIEILKNLVAEYDAQREENKTTNIVLVIDNKDINAIENLINRVKELEEIEEEHRKENGELREKIKEYEKIVETYNAIPNDYIPKDMKIVIADREYFNNGILKETCLPKSKIKEKIKEYDGLKVIDEMAYEEQIKPLQELLEE